MKTGLQHLPSCLVDCVKNHGVTSHSLHPVPSIHHSPRSPAIVIHSNTSIITKQKSILVFISTRVLGLVCFCLATNTCNWHIFWKI